MSPVTVPTALEKSKVSFKVLLVGSVNMRDTQIRAEVVASKNLHQKPFPLSLLLLKAKANETFLSVF